ncbi:MAG: GNAT family N-acetyltransferase [Acidobacteria bacterium]|jgi:GNAT superfamily N-acetyltransferase|nr:GNAT family N-acetyltransferase [Acidobacteriota bacterium]
MTDKNALNLNFKPLTIENWDDLVDLFGPKGCGGCWCMSFRLKKSDFIKLKGDGNKQAMRNLVEHQFTGLLAYNNGEAVAWCSMSPREQFIRIENSRILKRVEKIPAWSIPCLFIKKQYRRQGVSVEILKAAVEYAKKNNIQVLEAYPVTPYQDQMPPAFAWNGLLSAYEKAGFKITLQCSKYKYIVRYENLQDAQ